MQAMTLVLSTLLTFAIFVAAQPVREGNVERLVLDSGSVADANAWVVAEGTVTADTKHTKSGNTALRFHIDVNWETGEPKYPIGWPRMDKRLPQNLMDWSAYDYLEFSIFTESSRPDLPVSPLGLILSPKEGKTTYNRNLGELILGQWVDFRIPVSAVSFARQCAGVKFFISESNYKHGDVLDFWIDNLSLLRYTEPTVTSSRLVEAVILSDVRYLTVEVAMMGVKPGEQADVEWNLASKIKAVSSGKFRAARGTSMIRLALPSQGIPPGMYELTLKCKGAGPAPFPLRVVASPWQ